jgi:PEP-CTERM motif
MTRQVSRFIPSPVRRAWPALFTAVAIACTLPAAAAATVSMPTPDGPRSFASEAFAQSVLAGPGGDAGCFAGGVSGPCTPASFALAVLGPDLTTGLTLGTGADLTLALTPLGSTLMVWEAGAPGDTAGSLISVRTSAGWSIERDYGIGLATLVAGDTQPSGYATQYSQFSAADFGLAGNAVFDAVRLRTCCDAGAHLDLLAVAAVPEPATVLMLLPGLAALGWRLRRRRAA